MPAEMSADPHERTVIMSYRMFFAMCGLLLGSVAAPLLVEWYGGGRQGYASMSYIVGGVCALAMLTTFVATKHFSTGSDVQPSLSVRAAAIAGLGNKPFLNLIGAYVTQLVGVGAFTASAPYYFDHVLQRGASSAGIFFLFFFGATTLSMPLWAVVCRHVGKHRAYFIAVVLYSLLSLFFLAPDSATSLATVYGLAAVMGMPFGGIMMVPFSMLTDAIQLGTITHGQRREGAFTGIWTAGEKTGLAFGPLVAGTVLSLAGFLESAGDALVQPASAISGIRWTFAAAPAACAALSLLFLARYRLPESILIGSK
jgi:Na+/melibiose symporter-like transporter